VPKLNKKNKREEADNPQGITSRGDTFRRYWLITLSTILLPLLLGFAYLLLLREVSVQDNQVQHVSEQLAHQQAANVDHLFDQFKLRLTVAASSPLALAAIYSRHAEDVALVEKALLDYFPGVTSLRLITMGDLGTAGLEGSNLGLRNHIEVDMLRRTSQGEETFPESYQFEGGWLTSQATLIKHPRDNSKQAVMLATFDNKIISDTLASAGTDQGRSSLQQIFMNGNFTRADEIASAGNGEVVNYESSAKLNNGRWSLVYTPSALLLSQLRVNSTPVMAVLAVILLLVVGAMVALLFLFERSFTAEIERISAAADKKNSFDVAIPQLLPIAKLLRRATLRHTGRIGARAKSKLARREGEEGYSDPMFQSTDMIDKDEDEDTLVDKEPSPPPATPATDGGFPAHIFRAYDIRGVAPDELDDELVIRIGKALGTLAGTLEQQAFVVGCDGRTTSPLMRNTLVKALLDSGRDVIDIGIVPTPLLYYANQTLSTKTGVMVTGSHNPPEYNGFKITMDGKPFAGEQLEQLRDLVIEGKFSEGAGRLMKKDIRDDYIEAVVGDMAIAAPLKIVVDAGNGVAGGIGPILLEELGCEVVPLYCEVDGTFPNHHPDPSDERNLVDLQKRVQQEEADFGVAFDGDGDRIAVVTAEGQIVRTDKLLMLYAQDVVSRNPGADVIFDVKCSRHLTQLVSRYGGRPIMCKTGHAFMRQKVLETGALLAGEFSGHIFFGERWFGFDDGMYASARLAEIVSGAGADLTSLLSEFPDTESTPEIRIPVSDDMKFALMDKLINNSDFSPGKVNNLDGVRVDYNDGWGLVRASNTMPALTARFEAHDADSLERIMQQFREQLAEVAPDLEPGF
jgi:phosphomannomutase/phosphoglucomutase